MASKIKRLTIIAKNGVEQYTVGEEYNGLLLAEIRDNSIDDGEHIYVNKYDGITGDGSLVFEAINAPIEVSYSVMP